MVDLVPSEDPKILNDTYGDMWRLTNVNVTSGTLLLVIMTCLIGLEVDDQLNWMTL